MLSYLAAIAMAQMGTPSKMEIPLHYEPFDQIPVNLLSPTAGPRPEDDQAPSSDAYTLPASAANPNFSWLRIADKRYAVMIESGQTKANSVNRMWIDWNGDMKFTDDELALPIPNKQSSNSESLSFGGMNLVYRPTHVDESMPKVVIHVLGSRVEAIPGGCMVGMLPIGKGLRIGLVDWNLNGKYDDTFLQTTTGNPGDLICIDWNGNGKFDDPSPRAAKMQDFEQLPLGELSQLDGKNFYEITLSNNSQTLTATPYSGLMGTLKFVGGSPVVMALVGKKSIVYMDPVGSKMQVPAGSYSLSMLMTEVTDAKGKVWRVVSDDGLKSHIKPLAASQTIVKVGAPFKVALKAFENSEGVQFSLDIADAGGRPVQSIEDSKGKRPDAPTLKILDAKGKVVKALTFTYG